MRAQWVNLEIPINCELLEPFLGSSARAQWVNLEVPINCGIIRTLEFVYFSFLGVIL